MDVYDAVTCSDNKEVISVSRDTSDINETIPVGIRESAVAIEQVSHLEAPVNDEIIVPIDVDEISSEEAVIVVAPSIPTKAANECFSQNPLETEQNSCNDKSTEFVACTDDDEPISGNVDSRHRVKDELAEPIATAICTDDVLENDPMGLLEMNDRSDVNSSSRSNGDQDEVGDDISSTGSSSVHTTSSTSNVLEWCKEYSWLLYEESDEMYGYCLYCDAKLNVRSISSVKQHGLSLYHKERSDNYLAFREEEERNNLGTPLVQIKQEFGTDSYVAALKLKRKTQAEALNNYNWRRWLNECPWLERESPGGTIGHCKYCGIQLNVEFSYLRTRHQETGKHKESVKLFEQAQNNTNEQSSQKDDEDLISSSAERYRWCQPLEDDQSSFRCKICDTKTSKNNFLRHLRTNLHLRNETQYLNCLKREKSKNTKVSLSLLGNEAESSKSPPTWNMYYKQHPWLTADPSDNTYAFCKYCEKRITYGNSAAKRSTHENSIQHKNQEKLFKDKTGKDSEQEDGNEGASEGSGDASEGGDDEDEENGTQIEGDKEEEEDEEGVRDEKEEEEDVVEGEEEEEDNEDDEYEEEEKEDNEKEEGEEDEEEEYNGEQEDPGKDHAKQKGEEDSADNSDAKKRISRNDSEWYDQYSWCKRYKADPVNYFYCSYCKIVIGKSCRKKHSGTARHLSAESEFLKRQSKKKSLTRSKFSEDSFDWAVDIKSQPNLYYCKYCRVRISRHYSKKQHSVSKVHQINENLYNTNRRKSVKSEDNTEVSTPPPSSQQRNDSSSLTKPLVKVPSLITLIKQWQKKSTWLTYKRNELRSNYAYCKVCSQSLYIRSIKNVLKHQRSSKHIRTVNQLRRQKLQQEREQEEAKTTQVHKRGPKLEVEPNNRTSPEATEKEITEECNKDTRELSSKESIHKSTIGEMQKRYSWIEKSRNPQYAYCRYCNADVALKILFLRNHSNSPRHRQAVVNYRLAKTKSEKQRIMESNLDNEEEDDVVLVEDNNEEILISEQDDNWTVKSENMDEHEALDYLLQRSGKTNENSDSRQERKTGFAEDRPSKRVKRSHSFRRMNENNSSLVASILSTPLTLASCLGPLIQQQIQQVTNSQTQPSGTQTTASIPVPAEPENSFDLFFKSVSETMKHLPLDLATEGKLKVMGIICDLELKALKRQQPANAETEQMGSSSNLIVNSSVHTTSTNSNVVEEISKTKHTSVSDNDTTPLVQCDNVMNETVITPFYSNINASPIRNQPHQMGTTAATTSFPITPNEGARGDKSANSNQSPIIGVMDKNGLHTLQFKNTTVVKQVPKSNITAKSSSTSSIRCIPFKNLTQSVNTDGNTKITRIQVPMSSTTTPTSQNPQSTCSMITTNVADTPKGILNMRSIHITKRPAGAQQQSLPNAVSPLVTTTVSEQNTQGSYMASANVQRWTPMTGSSPTATTTKQAPIPNFHIPANQTSTPIARHYK